MKRFDVLVRVTFFNKYASSFWLRYQNQQYLPTPAIFQVFAASQLSFGSFLIFLKWKTKSMENHPGVPSLVPRCTSKYLARVSNRLEVVWDKTLKLLGSAYYNNNNSNNNNSNNNNNNHDDDDNNIIIVIVIVVIIVIIICEIIQLF